MTLAVRELSLADRLSNVSAELRPGEITAICGPNGAGKSSLLTAMAGLIKPTSGHVEIDADAMDRLHPRERAGAIGYLPQNGEVAWDVSVANLVALGRLPHRDVGDEAIARAMAIADLGDLTNRPVSTLSGGEKARALLARVLAGEPRWILADEPLAALDLAHQLSMLTTLRAEAKQGRGVVLVLHDLALAMNHADRVLVLRDGALIADGPPDVALSTQIIAQGWNVTARWLGEPGSRALIAG